MFKQFLFFLLFFYPLFLYSQNSLSLTENNVKEESPLPLDNNIETKSSPQPVESVNKAALPLESSEDKKLLSPHTDNKDIKSLSQPNSAKEKKSSPPETNENTEKPAEKSPFSIELETEGRFIKNSLSKNKKGFYPYIPYITLSFEYDILFNLKFFTELEFGSNQNLWNINLEQLGLFYRSNKFDLKAGRIPVSLGYSYANSAIFVHPLNFYKPFMAYPMDIGLRLNIPLYKEYLNFSISRFKGHLKRTFDNYYKPPEFAPLTVSLKSKRPSWNGFITYLKQDLAFQEPLNALGGGFTVNTSFLVESLISLQGELWKSGEKFQSSLSYYLFPKLNFNKYELGVLFGEIKSFAPDFKNRKATISIYKWILQGSYEMFPGVFLIGERWWSVTKQKKGPLVNNIWALRLKTKLNF